MDTPEDNQNQALSDSVLEQITDRIVEALDPYCVYLFGSVVNGRSHPGSDLDLAFLRREPADSYMVFKLAQDLASLAGCDVDLVDLERSSTVFQAQVVGNRRVLYCRDNTARQVFEMLAFKKYAKLNEERQVVLDKIQERGSVYDG